MQVFRYPVNVFHDFDRFLEHVGIDLLHDVGFQIVVFAQEVDFVGSVDVSYFDFFIGDKKARDTERLTYLLKLANRL